MIVYYYRYGDPLAYQDRSDAVLESISKDWSNIKFIFLPVDAFKNYLSGMGFSIWDLLYYSEPNYMISRIGSFVGIFTFNRYLIISFVFTNIGYFGFVKIYSACKKLVPGYNKILMIGCLYVPSCVYWSSALAKEPVCIIALGILFSSSIKLFFKREFSITSIFKLIFFGFVLYTVKDYIFICFLFAVIFWVVYDRIKAVVAKSVYLKLTLSVFLICMISILGFIFSNSLISIIKNNLGDIISSSVENYQNIASREGGSLIKIQNIDASSIAGILKFIPQGLVNVFFRPFPWEISNVLMIFTVLENLFFIYLFMRVAVKSRFFTRHLFINKNLQIFAILFSLSMAFILGISTFNFGTMVRYKIPFLPFWASFLLIINKKLSDRKNVAKV